MVSPACDSGGQMSTLFNKLHLIAICEYNTSKKLLRVVINPVLINFHKQGGQVWTTSDYVLRVFFLQTTGSTILL